MFNYIYCHKFLKLLPDIGSAVHVWVKVHIIGMQMVLHHMLVNPVNLRSTNHVFSQAKQPVHQRIFADGTVICIMLDV